MKKNGISKKIIYFIKIMIFIIFLIFNILYFDYQNRKKINDIINKYLITKPSKYQKEKKNERKNLKKLLSLKILPKDSNDTLYFELRSKLLEEFNKYGKKYFKEIKTIFLTDIANFGNTMIMLNNIIYYCEVLGCKNIFLNSLSYNNSWFIKHQINIGKINIDLKLESEINCKENDTFCFSLWEEFCLYPIVVTSEIRINLIKNEIHRNLPKIEVYQDELFIFIRSGDIFENCVHHYYPQPPLCFYLKILYNFKYRKVHIISKSNNNPVINALLEKFPKIIFKKNELKEDLAYLMNAYNLVGATSSMVLASIILNENLKIYWEYNIYRYSQKYIHLHFDIYKYPNHFIIYKMEPSEQYQNEFFVWKKTDKQLKLMLEEKCSNNFIYS